LNFVQERYDRGLTNEMDVALAKRQLAAFKATLAPLGAEIDAAQYSIAVLLGQYSGSLAREFAPRS
jgi:outer membrane protein TolC